MARFQREAEVLASLNHPNIAHIYGVEEHALVMELVEGEDLHGPLPLDTALQYARQIAEALEAAHEKGIIHRDLKPANIKVTPQGVVKMLDFGLAAMVQGPASVAGDPSASPTLTMRATQAGMIMGTAAYMSPEQAAGKPADRRADIWSFGVVLWEMLTGQRLFQGETVSHTLADVLRAEIDLAALPTGTPPAVRALLRRCLDRNVRNRLRDIGEARVALETAMQPSAEIAPPPARPAGKLPWIAAAAALIAAAVFGALYWRATRPVPRAMQRFDIPFTPVNPVRMTFAISPDGTRLAYVARGQDGIQRLFTRRLDQAEGVPLNETESATSPFFSPDGQWLAFNGGGALKKILVNGGTAIRICDALDMLGGSWGDDGNIVFTPNNRSPLYRVSANGGTPRAITKFATGEGTHRDPQVLPGSRAVVFAASAVGPWGDLGDIQLLTLPSGQVRTLHRGGFAPRWLPGGLLLWAHEGALFGAVLDVEKGQLLGAPVPVLDKLAAVSPNGVGNFDVSPAGVFVGVSGIATGILRSLIWLDAAGNTQTLALEPRFYNTPKLSPDGKRLAVVIGDEKRKPDIFLCDLEHERLNPLTFTGDANSPVWSPDGKRIVFRRTDPNRFYWVRTDGSGAPELLFDGAGAPPDASPFSFSPDGRTLLFNGSIDNRWSYWRLSVDLSDPEHPKAGKAELLPGTTNAGAARDGFSPDGRWIAYSASDEYGARDVFVQPYPATGGKWRISTAGGGMPIWSRNSRELFFVASGQIMVADYRVEGNSFVAGKPRPWSQRTISFQGGWDISPDGKRAILTPGAVAADLHLTFLLNFADELRRRLTPGK
jgi:serine/threonine-protein kinase